MTTKIGLIDGDIIVYQVAYEKKKEDTNISTFSTKGVSANKEDETEKSWEEVKKAINSFMCKLQEEVGFTQYHSFLSPNRANNFRKSFAFSQVYKGNRDKRELPKWFNEIKDYLVKHYGFIQLNTIETDDALGILQTYYNSVDDVESTICTKDKDLKQIEGRNYNWVTQELSFITNQQAKKILWTQMLTGDPGDNIVGCGKKQPLIYQSGTKKGQEYEKRVGVGPKEAETMLEKVLHTQYQARVLIEFIRRYGNFEGINKFYETFNLVYILRDVKEMEFHKETADIFTIANWNQRVNNESNEEDEEF